MVIAGGCNVKFLTTIFHTYLLGDMSCKQKLCQQCIKVSLKIISNMYLDFCLYNFPAVAVESAKILNDIKWYLKSLCQFGTRGKCSPNALTATTVLQVNLLSAHDVISRHAIVITQWPGV